MDEEIAIGYNHIMRFIGPHVSIQKGVSLSPERAHSDGATGFAIFTKNQRVWSAPAISEEESSAFRSNLALYGYKPECILPHAGYLINPASPDENAWEKSYTLFSDEADRTLQLSLSVINIHPGAYKEGDICEGFRRSAKMMDRILESHPGLKIAIENTSGAGTIIGSRFEELDAILSEIKEKDRVGFTLDTAHLFGAGYDVKSDPDGVLDSFFSRFGASKLYGMHLNDSKAALGSSKDRHESIGKGLIGKDAFIAIVRRKETEGIPLILETPAPELWSEEIAMLSELG